MKMKVIGRRDVSFKDKITGEQVEFSELHCVGKDLQIDGESVSIIRSKLPKDVLISVGSFYDFIYEPTSSGKAKLVAINKV